MVFHKGCQNWDSIHCPSTHPAQPYSTAPKWLTPHMSRGQPQSKLPGLWFEVHSSNRRRGHPVSHWDPQHTFPAGQRLSAQSEPPPEGIRGVPPAQRPDARGHPGPLVPWKDNASGCHPSGPAGKGNPRPGLCGKTLAGTPGAGGWWPGSVSSAAPGVSGLSPGSPSCATSEAKGGGQGTAETERPHGSCPDITAHRSIAVIWRHSPETDGEWA